MFHPDITRFFFYVFTFLYQINFLFDPFYMKKLKIVFFFRGGVIEKLQRKGLLQTGSL